MKQFILILILSIALTIPIFTIQTSEDEEISRTQDYTNAILKKTPQEKINALQAYIKKYPDTNQKFTKLAYYMLTVSYFHEKNYVQTAKIGEKTMTLGDLPSRGEQARLYLVVGNSYGIKSISIYNKDKAIQYTNRAITLARGHDQDVLEAAKNLKKKLTGPPPVKLTPEQKIKMLVFQDNDYNGAISYYKSLGQSDKKNPDIHEVYATALLKAKRYNDALTEFNALYSADKKGKYAKNLAEIYSNKARARSQYYTQAVDYYIKAALLFRKEGSISKHNAAMNLGKYQLFERYKFNDKIKKYNIEQQKNKSSAAKNEAAIRQLERELRKHERYLRRTYEYNDLDPPAYEVEKTKRLEKKIEILKAGGNAQSQAESEKLMAEKKKIEKEFEERVADIKKRF